jgi:hypothetical protein
MECVSCLFGILFVVGSIYIYRFFNFREKEQKRKYETYK